MPTSVTRLGGAISAVLILCLHGCTESDDGSDVDPPPVIYPTTDGGFGADGGQLDAGYDSGFGHAYDGGWPPVGSLDAGFTFDAGYAMDGSFAADAGPSNDAGAISVDSGAPRVDAGGAAADGGRPDGGVTPPAGGFSTLATALPPGRDYSGWTWVDVPGSKCRDGSGAGYYWRRGKTDSLMVYLNGGGACADPFFCGLNPVNVDQDLPIELLIGGAINLVAGPNASRQQAPDEGIFKRDARNPVSDWNMIYVPYCTGDIHAGSRENVEVPGVPGRQQFVGYRNLGLFLNSFGPSFKGHAKQVLLTGSSAGGFGSLLNYDRFSEYFTPDGSEVLVISDSGLPMRDPYMSACLQQKWRDYWSLNDAFPAACTACKGSGGGLTQAAFNYYFTEKYVGKFMGGLVTTVNDQIIRAFFAPGMNATAGGPDNCTLEPGLNTITSSFFLGQYSGDKYREGLADVLDRLVSPNQIGFYAMAGENHMHLWRPNRYFEKNGTDKTIAEWVADILAKKPTKTGDQFMHPR